MFHPSKLRWWLGATSAAASSACAYRLASQERSVALADPAHVSAAGAAGGRASNVQQVPAVPSVVIQNLAGGMLPHAQQKVPKRQDALRCFLFLALRRAAAAATARQPEPVK